MEILGKYNEDETSEEYFANKFMNKAATREATLELIDTWDLALTADADAEQEDLGPLSTGTRPFQGETLHFEAAWAKRAHKFDGSNRGLGRFGLSSWLEPGNNGAGAGGGLQFSDTKDFVNFMLEKHPKKKVEKKFFYLK